MTEGESGGSQEEQKRIAELALAILTMRVNTPAGQWVADTYGDQYYDIWREATRIEGDEADESMFLSMLNLADLLVEYLNATTGKSSEFWLRALRADYIDSIETD